MLRFSPNIVSLHDLGTIYSTITDVEAFLSGRPRPAEARGCARHGGPARSAKGLGDRLAPGTEVTVANDG